MTANPFAEGPFKLKEFADAQGVWLLIPSTNGRRIPLRYLVDLSSSGASFPVLSMNVSFGSLRNQ